ncbi:MAG: right-handed parallel beta-helix repeat-containing protein, partial [bacterium]|nr:right-handed parallel beta-helix repeat-containing protein [bacterium]
MFHRWVPLVLLLALHPGCGPPQNITHLSPGADIQKRAQTAFINAKPGDIIEFAEGRYVLTRTLSLDVPGVTLRGKGSDKTILSFKDQETGSGGEGLLITQGGFTLEQIAIEDTRGDAIKVENADRVFFKHVRVAWTGEPAPTNGAYGIYPVKCRNVLIENCTAIGASDAGIYVGQCENIIVRNNMARNNVAGIEIENSVGADVYNNLAVDNTSGILVFTLPNLPKNEGHTARVFGNTLTTNNHPNFAKKGTLVSGLPPGNGLIIMANDRVEVFENQFADNHTAHISILSFRSTRRKIKDEAYDAFCEAISIHNNRFEGGGSDPQGEIGQIIRQAFGTSGPDIVYDGIA